jgi:hypothetical protein
MAEKKSPTGTADFIAKIVKDPKNPPETLMLTGFIGASSEEGHTRLYFDAGLASYVEIPNDAILHTEPAGDSGLGASYVWIKRDAVLIYGPAGSQRPKGTFLEGPIMQQHLGAAAPAAGAGQAMPGPMAGSIPCSLLCPSFATGCAQQAAAPGGNPRSDFVACNSWICPPSPFCPPSDFVPCQSNNWICPPTPNCPKSDFVACVSWICPPTPHAHCVPTPPLLCMTAHCTVPPQCHLPTHPPGCPLLSAPPNCPTVGACPSIACQSAACQPGGGQAGGLEAAAAPVSAICVTAIGCPTLPPICGIVPPSHFGPCLTQQPHCVTAFIPCPTPQPACPTLWHPCPTHQFHCPSVVMICPTVVCQKHV